jgi:hypothetical protein
MGTIRSLSLFGNANTYVPLMFLICRRTRMTISLKSMSPFARPKSSPSRRPQAAPMSGSNRNCSGIASITLRTRSSAHATMLLPCRLGTWTI